MQCFWIIRGSLASETRVKGASLHQDPSRFRSDRQRAPGSSHTWMGGATELGPCSWALCCLLPLRHLLSQWAETSLCFGCSTGAGIQVTRIGPAVEQTCVTARAQWWVVGSVNMEDMVLLLRSWHSGEGVTLSGARGGCRRPLLSTVLVSCRPWLRNSWKVRCPWKHS